MYISTVYKSTHRSDTVNWKVWGLDEPTVQKDIFRSVGKIPTWTALKVGLLKSEKVQDNGIEFKWWAVFLHVFSSLKYLQEVLINDVY